MIFTGFFLEPVRAQNQSIADSLKVVVQNDSLSLVEKAMLYCEISMNSSSPNEIIFYSKKALDIANEYNKNFIRANALYLLGDGYKLRGDLIYSIDSYLDGIKYYESEGHVLGIATGYINIAGIYKSQNNFEESVNYYQKAELILEEYPISFQLAAIYNNMGEVYRLQQKFDSAFSHYKRAISLFTELDSDIGVAYSLGNIGLCYASLNKNDSAEHYLLKSTQILQKMGDKHPISVYNLQMADIYLEKGEKEKALQYAHNSLNIAKEEELKEQIRDANLKLSELYSNIGDYEKAYDFQNQYITYRDSINNANVIRKMADLRMEYELSKKQTEIDLLNNRNKNQTILNYTMAGGVLMLLILGHLFFQNSQKSKEVNRVLSDQKDQIEIQRDKLTELINIKNRFFGIISHDLRSPVNSLQGISQLLKQYVLTKQFKEVREFVGLADQSIQNLSTLLDNLLSWALSQQGSLPYNPERFNFYYVVKEVESIFQNAALAKNINVINEVPSDIKIYADRDGVMALTRNLINNSLKFTRPGGSVKISAGINDRYIRIVFEDTGIGIPEDKLKKLFEFEKEKSTKGTAGEKGSGLGLTLCFDIIKINEGSIEASSKPNQGTKFIVNLPSNEFNHTV